MFKRHTRMPEIATTKVEMNRKSPKQKSSELQQSASFDYESHDELVNDELNTTEEAM